MPAKGLPPTSGPDPGPSSPNSNQQSQCIPPIVLRKKDRWSKVSKELKARGLYFSNARTTSDGIKFTPESINAYRATAKFLDSNREQFHTYQLPEDRLTQVIIRGLPLELEIKEVADELGELGFHPRLNQILNAEIFH
ncbi:unnamed protein product [Brassicogethes aeneus]|uniref:Uncharacterized protein n=1 Tax=Brassicogethes aeneus TaxID=1431903 RepID=A0A9P0AZY8_BRAAE|nr:unnamed protein product [Brassicogethes aeneus]